MSTPKKPISKQQKLAIEKFKDNRAKNRVPKMRQGVPPFPWGRKEKRPMPQ